MYYLGIDISKKSFTVSILDEEGEAITKVIIFKKILLIMYSMLKYQADYDPQRIFFQFEKEQVLI